MRAVMEPCDSLKREQQWILTNILSQVPVSEHCHGFVSGRSIVTNASQHCAKSLVINVDLTSFFHAVTFQRVRGILLPLGCSMKEANRIAAICTITRPDGRYLPQGACTSPSLANLAARNLDSRLHGLASSLGMVYTRYADDMTFSGNTNANLGVSNERQEQVPSVRNDSHAPSFHSHDLRNMRASYGSVASESVGRLLYQCRRIILSEGFQVNERKTRIMCAPDIRLVTGLDVSGVIPAIPLKTLERYVRLLSRPHSIQQTAGIRGHMCMVNK